MLKISGGQPDKQTITLRLEGRVAGPWVGELQRVCEPLKGNCRTLALDLLDVSYADEEGVELLMDLKTRGVVLVNATPFVAEQLKSPD